jgi:Polyketide cyclase / dehydrase and lipid transport
MAWHFEHSALSSARREEVWPRYADVEHWSEWSQKGVEWSRIDGPFEAGTEGKTKAPGFPASRFRLTAVEPERMFASEATLPGARLVFEHVIESVGAGVQITHRARVEGPMAWLWAALMRRSIERGLPDGVDRLAKLAASRS